MTEPRYLLDVNALIALTVEDHVHFQQATRWFNMPGRQWALCPITEMGFLRISITARSGPYSVQQAAMLLRTLCDHSDVEEVALHHSWLELTKPLTVRLHGARQVTDAYLLGLAIRENLVLATFDKGFLHLAGEQFRRHVLVLSAA